MYNRQKNITNLCFKCKYSHSVKKKKKKLNHFDYFYTFFKFLHYNTKIVLYSRSVVTF